MQQQGRYRTGFLFIILFVSLFILMSLALPIHAQGGAFATNTPIGADDAVDDESEIVPLIFATNTPVGAMPSADSEIMIETGPQDILFNYGMRFWLEADFVQLVFDQIQSLDFESDEAKLAANLLLYELESRFPSAPNNPEQRLQLINAMINTPAGSLDMRQILHPLIQIAIDNNLGSTVFEVEGFAIELTEVNLDGLGEIDRIVHVSYADDGELLYDEYLLATANDSGSFTILPMSYDLPAVPFGDIDGVSLEYLQDVNRDGIDELVLGVDDGGASDHFYIIEHRNGRAVDLVDPSIELRVGNIVNWNVNSEGSAVPVLTVLETQANSAYPDWQCNSQIEYTWRYERNLYRRSQDLNARYNQVDSMGCTLSDANLFALPVPEAISTVESAILEYGFDAPSGNRALMTLSMLYVLTGRLDDARNTAASTITVDDDTTWESIQGNALIQATNASGNTAIDICEAVAMASEFPACDMNAVLGNVLSVLNLDTDADLETQLNDLGLPVLESVVVSQVGQADRIAVSFNLFATEWWGFYDGRDGLYRVEPIEAPITVAEASFPQALLSAPQNAIDALFVDNNPARVLTILDNIVTEKPDIPLSPSALYLQALAHEISGDRERAREDYYTIWDRYRDSFWGDIAAPHLELR